MTKKQAFKYISELDEDAKVVEFAGPTPDGYEFFVDNKIKLKPKVEITNLTNPIIINPFGDKPLKFYIDKVVDIRKKLPYKDTSLDMCMFASLVLCKPIGSFNKFHEFMMRFEYSIRCTRPIFSIHIKAIRNIYRCLKPGGYLLIQNAITNDIILAKRLGYEVVYNIGEGSFSDTLILRRPS